MLIVNLFNDIIAKKEETRDGSLSRIFLHKNRRQRTVPCLLLVKFSSCRDPVIYEQEVKHFLSVILVDCADQHAV